MLEVFQLILFIYYIYIYRNSYNHSLGWKESGRVSLSRDTSLVFVTFRFNHPPFKKGIKLI